MAAHFFFVTVLGVREVLTEEDLRILEYDGSQRPRMAGRHGYVSEGLPLPRAAPARDNHSEVLDFNMEHFLHLALRNAQEAQSQSVDTELPVEMSAKQVQNKSAVASSNPRQTATNPAKLHETSGQGRSRRRQWWRHGNLGGAPIFVAGDVAPPWVPCPDISLLHDVYAAAGLRQEQLAFAYDSSGCCVCDELLFLDMRRVPFAQELSRSEAALFWATELAHAIAHQGLGPAIDDRLLQLMSGLIARIAPQTLGLTDWD